MELLKVLALGAHYDDVEAGAGGTLWKHRLKNDHVSIAITSFNEIRTGNMDMRHKEQLDSLSLLGINNLLLFKEEDDNVVSILDKLKPDIIYTMFESDTHYAHRRCSRIGQAVGRRSQVIFYNSGTSYDFLPNMFSIISFRFKQKLLECFKSQIELSAINIDIIQRRESYWASLVSANHAEGFVVRKMVYKI